MHFDRSIVLIITALLSGASLAAAGPLARTGRAIDQKSESDSRASSPSTTIDTYDDRDRDHDLTDSSTTSTTSTTSSYCYDCSEEAVVTRIPKPHFEARLAAQKVLDSDGSARVDASVVFGRLGLYAGTDYYYEHIAAKGAMGEMSEDVRVNLFELAMLGRVLSTEVLQVDLRMGFGTAASSLFDTLPGAVVGAVLRARANETLTLQVEGRAMALKHDIQAYEGATGIQVNQFWLGYRALKFDVGPVLQGPEAGVRLRF